MSRPPVDPHIGSLSRVVWQSVRRRIYDAAIDAGYDDLKPAHLAVFRNPTSEGMRPTELADELQITKQSINEVLAYLERHDYLKRDPDPDDNRSRRIRLTKRGREVERVVGAAARRAERDAAKVIGDKRMRDLHRSLTDLVAHLADNHS